MANAIGVCTAGGWLGATDEQIKWDVDKIAETGFKWVRWDWSWVGIELKEGQVQGRPLERRVMIAEWIRKAGMHSLPVLGYTPSFYRRPALATFGSKAPPAEQHYDAWARYVGTCVEAGESQGVIRFEHWNESNHEPFWKYPSVKDQADMLRLAKAAARAANPNARIVLGAFAPGKTRPVEAQPGRYHGINMVDYVDWWYEQGYKDLVEAWSVHPYSTDNPEERFAWSVMTTQFDAIRDILVANGHGTRKVWGTEFGYTTEPFDAGGRPQRTQEKQAELLVKQVSLWQAKAGAGPGFVFNWRDFPAGTKEHPNAVNGLGIVTDRTSSAPNGRFKKAREALRQHLT
jgi:hypothetical protein